jgi:hypothetical protein
VLVAERHDLVCMPASASMLLAEQVDDPVAQLVHVEVGGVDDHVGLGLHRLEQRPLGSMASAEAVARRSERVAAAGALVAAHQHVGGGLEEQDAHPGAPARSRRARGAPRRSPARCPRRAPPGRSPAPGAGQLGHLGDELGRQVVDDEPAEVLEVSAACDRPAPDSPVMTTKSLTLTWTSRGYLGGGRSVLLGSATRTSRRGMVAASSYSGAGRGTRRRRRLSMRSSVRPGVGQRVDVAATAAGG